MTIALIFFALSWLLTLAHTFLVFKARTMIYAHNNDKEVNFEAFVALGREKQQMKHPRLLHFIEKHAGSIVGLNTIKRQILLVRKLIVAFTVLFFLALVLYIVQHLN